MGQELRAVGAIRSMLSARASVEVVLAKEVGWLFQGRQLASIHRGLASAADDARRGADAIATELPATADQLREAAAVLEGVRTIGTSSQAWRAGRSEVGRARDLIEGAIVDARDSLAPHRQGEVDDIERIVRTWVDTKQLDADEWGRIAELAELPVGMRPPALEHVGAREVKLLREQATRVREGLALRKDPRIDATLQAIANVSPGATREQLEAALRSAAEDAIGGAGKAEQAFSVGQALRHVAGLQMLDSTIRPRMLSRMQGIDFAGAADLQLRGAVVPTSWEGFRALRGVTYLEHPQPALEQLLMKQPETFSPTEWRMLADMVRLPAGERPAALAGFTAKAARDMERAARMVEDGITLPASWKGFSRVNQLRANVLWAAPGPATEHMSRIASLAPGDVTKADLSDLDALRQLRDGVRPAALDPGETIFAELAASAEPLTHPSNAEKLERFTALSLTLKSPDELRATLDRIDGHVDELLRIQETWTEQAPRGVLNSFAADLRLLRGFELDDTVKQLMRETSELVDHNINRLDGKVGGGYGRHVDYGEVGRVRENVRLFTELAREQALGESNTIARARQARAAAEAAARAPQAGDQPAAAAAADDMLSW